MFGACPVSLIALVLSAPPETAALVARLGSGTPAEREEAAGKLEAMGRAALPALESALKSPDVEVRGRVLAVWERIERGLMLRPRMIRLEIGDRPLTEVVRSIGDQSGFSMEISPQREESIITIREAVVIPFWEAIGRLGIGGHFHEVLPSGSHFPTLEFGAAVPDYPSTISDPFRIELEGVHDHRDRLLIAGPWLGMDELNPKIPIPRTAREHEARFYVGLGMMIEPRSWFTQEGPARAIEAVDDLGQSLVRRDTSRVEADRSFLRNARGATEGHFQLDLAMPERPGRTIARLRGTVPVAIQVRRPVAAPEIPLPSPEGQAFPHEDAVFALPEFRDDERLTRIVLEFRLDLDRFELPAGPDRAVISSRLQCLADHQLDVVYADGRMLAELGAGMTRPDGSGRRTFVVRKTTGRGRPARLRYYQMIRVFTDVPFKFRDILTP